MAGSPFKSPWYLVTIAIYCITVFTISSTIAWFNQIFGEVTGGVIATILVLLSTLPFLFWCKKYTDAMDEMEKSLYFSSMIPGFIIGVVFCLSYALLEIFIELPSLNGFVYYSVFMAAWAITSVIKNRQMR